MRAASDRSPDRLAAASYSIRLAKLISGIDLPLAVLQLVRSTWSPPTRPVPSATARSRATSARSPPFVEGPVEELHDLGRLGRLVLHLVHHHERRSRDRPRVLAGLVREDHVVAVLLPLRASRRGLERLVVGERRTRRPRSACWRKASWTASHTRIPRSRSSPSGAARTRRRLRCPCRRCPPASSAHCPRRPWLFHSALTFDR